MNETNHKKKYIMPKIGDGVDLFDLESENYLVIE
jgi:hypothetical protein